VCQPNKERGEVEKSKDCNRRGEDLSALDLERSENFQLPPREF
jgi:hypothetical protein